MKPKHPPKDLSLCWTSTLGICQLLLGMFVAAVLFFGCASGGRRPTVTDLHMKNGRERAVVLLRVTTEIDGKVCPAFPSRVPLDSIWLGLGDFSTGGKLRVAPLDFLSRETRLEGWTYLLLEPGNYYLAPHAPQNESSFACDSSWRSTPPRWRLQVPHQTPVIYAGTLFVPGTGLWQIFGDRRMSEFDAQHFEVRDEAALAAVIHKAWLKDLGGLSTQLFQPHLASEPIILETPPGR